AARPRDRGDAAGAEEGRREDPAAAPADAEAVATRRMVLAKAQRRKGRGERDRLRFFASLRLGENLFLCRRTRLDSAARHAIVPASTGDPTSMNVCRPAGAARGDCAMPDQTTTISTLRDSMRTFVRERDWEQFHSPKNLAMALS